MRVGAYSIWAVIAAGVVIYVIGFLWYGLIFAELWVAASGFTQEELEGGDPRWMMGGIPIPILIAAGLALVLSWSKAASLVDALKTAGLVWLGFGLPVLGYTLVYSVDHSIPLFLIDGAHLLATWLGGAATLAALRGLGWPKAGFWGG